MSRKQASRAPGEMRTSRIASAANHVLQPLADTRDYASFARRLTAARKALGQYFTGNLFADPALDILLELFVAGEDRRSIGLTHCCAAAGVPPIAALRWIEMLKGEQLVVATPDPRDARRTELSLTERARQQMRNYLNSLSTTPLQRRQ